MRNTLRIVFVLFILILLFPMLNDNLNLFKIKALNGAFKTLSKPKLDYKTWWNGTFQDSYTEYKSQSIKFRPVFVRINNQLDFSLFKKTNATKLVIGKQNYLFEDNYINAYTGKDFIGIAEINKKVKRALRVQQALENIGVDMIFVFLPGKATYFSEFIPNRFLNSLSDSTNYKYFKEKTVNSGLNIIDYNDWFLRMKDTVNLPLYPKCGIHWSYYGMYLVADSLINFIDSRLSYDIPTLCLNSIEISEEQRGTDYDIGNTLNLLFPISTYPMPYPNISYNTEHKQKPKVLVIGDSYYWNMYYSGIPGNVFSKLDFWYYNHNIHNDGTSTVVNTTDNIDFKSEISKQDVILIMQTDGGLNNFGLGFFEKAEQYLNSNSFDLRVEYYKNKILNDIAWQNHIREKALKQGVSFEEMIERDARYMVQQEN